jgi:hypothetical protein
MNCKIGKLYDVCVSFEQCKVLSQFSAAFSCSGYIELDVLSSRCCFSHFLAIIGSALSFYGETAEWILVRVTKVALRSRFSGQIKY